MGTRTVSEADCEALRREVREFFRVRPDINAEQFSIFTTISPPAMRQYLAGHLNCGLAMYESIRTALEQAKAGDILTPGGSNAITLTDSTARRRRVARAGTFYRTETVRKVGETMEFCAEHCAIGVITADFGVGKTEAVKHWRGVTASKIDSVVYEFDEFTAANKVEFISMLATSFGLATAGGSANAGRVFRDVCAYLREHPCLLILDQCEAVRPRVLQVVRQIWDRTADAGVGIVLLGAPILLMRMLGGKRADLGALTSRVGVWAPLAGITRGEMADIIRQEGIADVDDGAFDLWYRAIQGSMRRLMRSMDLIKSKHAGRRVTEKTVTGVAGHLFGMRIAEAA